MCVSVLCVLNIDHMLRFFSCVPNFWWGGGCERRALDARKKKEKKMIDARGSNTKSKLPARRPTLRRISATQHTRSSAGFELGILPPMTTTLIQTPPDGGINGNRVSILQRAGAH